MHSPVDSARGGDMSEFLSGARTCAELLKNLPDTLTQSGDLTTEQYYQERDRAIRVFLEAAGPVSERAAGVIAALAEVLVVGEQDGAYADPSIPLEAAMTEEEKRASRQEFIDFCATSEISATRSNVVRFPAH